ncbi:MAG: hypothetical protein IT201_11475 [Thermoleophilia bacterium]|nr:hypothetical protein [Thermoleophilia bacterium]
MSRLAVTTVVLALVAGTAAAFAVAERLKLERSPITAPRFDRLFSPVCECETGSARLRLRFRRAETVDATIVDASGEHVRALVRGERIRAGDHVFVWDGRDDAGEVASDGRYRLRLRLVGERRTILVPTTVQLDATPPEVTLVGVEPDVFSPDGDGRRDRTKVFFRSSERGRAELDVNGEPVVRSPSRPGGKAALALRWGGRLGGELAGPGVYEVTVRVRDAAGNLSEPAGPLPVEIRFVRLDRGAYTAEAGGTLTFGAEADAVSFAWSLHRDRDGQAGKVVLRGQAEPAASVSVALPPQVAPGAYVLRVSVGERRDRARVTVTETGS